MLRPRPTRGGAGTGVGAIAFGIWPWERGGGWFAECFAHGRTAVAPGRAKHSAQPVSLAGRALCAECCRPYTLPAAAPGLR